MRKDRSTDKLKVDSFCLVLFKIGSHNILQTGLEFQSTCSSLLCVDTIAMCLQVHLCSVYKGNSDTGDFCLCLSLVPWQVANTGYSGASSLYVLDVLTTLMLLYNTI